MQLFSTTKHRLIKDHGRRTADSCSAMPDTNRRLLHNPVTTAKTQRLCFSQSPPNFSSRTAREIKNSQEWDCIVTVETVLLQLRLYCYSSVLNNTVVQSES